MLMRSWRNLAPLPRSPAVLHTLQEKVYHDKQYLGGFKIRAIILIVLNDCRGPCATNNRVIMLSIAYMVVLELQRCNSNPPQRRWMYQYIRRPTGEILVINSRLVIAFMGVISAGGWIWIVVESMLLFIQHRPLGPSLVARAFISCLIFLHGWVAVWSVFTTYVLTNQPDRTTFLSSIPAVIFNASFIGSSLAMLLGCIATGVWNLRVSYQFWGSFIDLESFLIRALDTFPNNAPDASVELAKKSLGMSEATNRFLSVTEWTYGILCIPAFTTVLFSLTGLLLARDLGKHIRHSKKSLARNMSIPGARSVASCCRPEAPWMLLEGDNIKESENESPTCSSKHVIFTAEELRRIAKSDSIHGTRARTIALVTKARSELLLVSACVGVNAAALIAIMTYVATMCGNGQLKRGSWVATEVSAMGAAWVCSICLSVATVALIYNNWVHRGATSLLGLSQNILEGDELNPKQGDTLYNPSAVAVLLEDLRPTERPLREDKLQAHHSLSMRDAHSPSKTFALPPLEL
ncbi:BZ3500_MvSof-1268-A1-R1_Chr5-2g07794 [Microbotryum saponariae]|uniref:BZ3500_MvSof-1268-A1-R1_Chr5-2g07794 protein n=1 Tax=Microbotryum saponariae TaxID=289078 RepID=A0A2X0L0Z9_9BASI|nr:BZ3500_MvSof-1268-A1-R1_Chr5-2g07794 [Microbotryum saponariae]SDA05663.1 BZ3501_MvSof-1269-A2-R1_Chr5-2g07616 [Microbotryum saponariae]